MSMVLLAEGQRDTEFFRSFCRSVGLTKIKVSPPSDHGAGGDGKGNAITLLPELLMQLRDGSIKHLGVVLDADYKKFENHGFKSVSNTVRQALMSEGYTLPGKRVPSGGLLFQHDDGLPPVGLWIMPNNKDDGMLEDFIKTSITDTHQLSLLQAASTAVRKITNPLFDTNRHLSKAEIATWLAWQKMPGQPLAAAGSKLIDVKSSSAVAFHKWLIAIFT